MFRHLLFLLLLTASLTVQAQRCEWLGAGKPVNPYQYQQQKSGSFSNGAVASAHPLASAVGAQILQQGGNAFDAGVAVQLALAVVYPGAGNIGGGGFMLAKTDTGFIALDFREQAPAKAHRNMYLDSAGNAQTERSQNGHLAAGVPGTVAGLFATMPYCKLPFKQLVQPAIDLAQYGFVITEREAANLNNSREAFLKYNTLTPVFVKAKPWKVGDTLIQKDLAHTLIRIRDKGAKGFYEGRTAALLLTEMNRGKGIISIEDLRNYKTKFRKPLQFQYRGHQVVGFPPPSSGGIILWQVLKMLEPFNLAASGFQSAEMVQPMVEAERRAYADRSMHMGDADFYKVPVSILTNDAYLKQRMSTYQPGVAGKSEDVKAGVINESTETTHISIYDKDGNMVSITTTLNGSYGSKTVVAGAGFLLNNEMDDFSIKPGVPNMYGAVGGEANAIEPGKRMLSSMCPVLVLKEGKPFLVAGTPGGTTIPTSMIQTLVNIIDFNQPVANAVNNPKFHHQWLPDVIMVEKNFPAVTREKLQQMGYTIKEIGGIGRVEAIRINTSIDAAADIRGDDSVAGY